MKRRVGSRAISHRLSTFAEYHIALINTPYTEKKISKVIYISLVRTKKTNFLTKFLVLATNKHSFIFWIFLVYLRIELKHTNVHLELR